MTSVAVVKGVIATYSLPYGLVVQGSKLFA